MTYKSFVFLVNSNGLNFEPTNPVQTASEMVLHWTDLAKSLAEQNYEYQKKQYILSANWESMVAAQKQHLAFCREIESYLRDRTTPPNKTWDLLPEQKIKILIEVKSNEVINDDIRDYSQDYAISYLYDFFLIASLSYPSSVDFYHAELTMNDAKQFESQREAISLSGDEFGVWLTENDVSDWLKPKRLDVAATARWYFAHMDGRSQIARTGVQKALFALWHLSKLQISPLAIIWIFYALESLFKTNVGNNRNDLKNRIALLLELNLAESAKLSKLLRKIYEVRSSVVHGGMDIVHPMNNEVFDRNVDKEIFSILEISKIGFSILARCIQKIAENGWTDYEFEQNTTVKFSKL
jgi:hypothetical protein